MARRAASRLVVHGSLRRADVQPAAVSTGEDRALVSPVDDAIKTMAVVEACYRVQCGRRHADPVYLVAMRIDTHQHFWRYRLTSIRGSTRPRALQRDFRRPMQPGGDGGRRISASLAVQATHSTAETDWLLESRRRPVRSSWASSAGWICRRTSTGCARQLRHVGAHPKLVGIRHLVQDEADDRFLLRPAFCRGIALLEEFDLSTTCSSVRGICRGCGVRRRGFRRSASSSITWRSPRSAGARSIMGAAISVASRSRRTSGPRSRGSSPKRPGTDWTSGSDRAVS